MAIAMSDTPSDSVLVFEDSKHGIKAARSANLNVVYVIDRDPIDVSELECLDVVESFSQILEKMHWKDDEVVMWKHCENNNLD
jgi:beta-phosphoglucomutase-like phosphatase (HAD superfamily)